LTTIIGEKEDRTAEKIKSLYEEWLNLQAKEIFYKKVFHLSALMKVSPKRIAVKKLKNRWGSITEKETINLNVNLIKTPEDVIDYIITHELCHFRIKGHSHHFWNYLNQFAPNYHKKIDWLKRNSDMLV